MEPGKKRTTKGNVKKFLQNQGKKTPLKDKLVGGSGAFGLVGSGGGGVVGKMASRFLGKASKTVSKLAKGGKKVPKSKPVDFKGPNPAHNIGAGGNSYPR